MIKKACQSFLAVLTILTLFACGSHMPSVDKLGGKSRDDFMYAMRWKQYGAAAGFMQQQEDRDHFLKTFRAAKDLHIIDLRVVDMKNYEGGKRFHATMEMDYYLPPSVTLKTFTFDQIWVYSGDDDSMGSGFQIVTPFPDFP